MVFSGLAFASFFPSQSASCTQSGPVTGSPLISQELGMDLIQSPSRLVNSPLLDFFSVLLGG